MTLLKELLPFSKSLTVLYVEDDIGIRDNYVKVFSEIFTSVDVANNGEEGLEKYQNSSYDIVITDINMPRMNGIEMLQNIIKTNPGQAVIVTSAHDEAHYLLSLIDLGIENFLIKPVDFDKMTKVIYRSCKRIAETRELRDYHSRIEEENLRSAQLLKELQDKNDELERTVHKLTRNENVNIALIEGIENDKQFTPEELNYYALRIKVETAKDFVETFPGDLETFNDNLEAIEETLELLIHQKLLKPTEKSLHILSSAFYDYGTHLANLYRFNHTAEALQNFGKVLAEVEDLTLLKDMDMKSFLFGIAGSLRKWRQEVIVNQTAEDIHFLDNSIISDCLQTESMLSGGEDEEDKDLDDLFF